METTAPPRRADLERIESELAAQRVEHNVVAGRFAEIVLLVVRNHDIGAERANEIGVAAACCRSDVEALGFRKLDGEGAHPPEPA